jgi:hypothetical protein
VHIHHTNRTLLEGYDLIVEYSYLILDFKIIANFIP